MDSFGWNPWGFKASGLGLVQWVQAKEKPQQWTPLGGHLMDFKALRSQRVQWVQAKRLKNGILWLGILWILWHLALGLHSGSKPNALRMDPFGWKYYLCKAFGFGLVQWVQAKSLKNGFLWLEILHTWMMDPTMMMGMRPG